MARARSLAALITYPLSKIYGLVMAIRNKLFDTGILKQHTFDIPIVVVGNLSMGGTGKTPHVEYAVRTLRDRYNIGVLSRGYKRHTSGFVLASEQSRPEDIGDESYQIYRKFGPDITVAVCEKRVEGIRKMRQINPSLNMIILDDAFQHRYVKPWVTVLLTEYSRPLFNDAILPYGRLRESARAINRADIVVVTKCPDDMKPLEYRIFKEKLDLFPFQRLYFSRYAYGHLVPVFADHAPSTPTLEALGNADSILAVTGVANPKPFTRHLRKTGANITLKRFSDHHNFTPEDMDQILEAYEQLPTTQRIIATTEKDAVRLLNNPYFPHQLKPHIFYIPITVRFIDYNGTEADFTDGLNKTIRDAKLFHNQ